MKFCVIGEPCIDYIHRGSAAQRRYGGILYCAVSLSVLSGAKNEIVPVMNVGEDEYDDMISFLKGFGNINTSHIIKTGHKTRVVNLYYKIPPVDEFESRGKTYDREENSTEPTPALEFESIEPALKQTDGVLLSMISGTDITFDAFKKMRENFKGYIHFDAHNIVMETHPDGQRIQRPVENWKQWCTIPDTLQMNESEIKIISPDKLREYDIADSILSEAQTGTRALAVTRGLSGATLFRKTMKQVYGEKYLEIDRVDIPAVESRNFKDSTGCGDVFASAFFYRNMTTEKPDFGESLRYANRIAGIKTSLIGVEELYKLSR